MKKRNTEEAFHREAFEEGYVKRPINYLGAIAVSHEENPLFNANSKYPLIGYQMFYYMEIQECLPFLRKHEQYRVFGLSRKEYLIQLMTMS